MSTFEILYLIYALVAIFVGIGAFRVEGSRFIWVLAVLLWPITLPFGYLLRKRGQYMVLMFEEPENTFYVAAKGTENKYQIIKVSLCEKTATAAMFAARSEEARENLDR